MPLQRRLPKRGFRNPARQEFSEVNLSALDAKFSAGAVVDPASLAETGLVRKKNTPVKVLAKGSVTKPLTVRAHAFSAKAKQLIEAAGGTVEVI
jgi:large subunit ribosomal protein L15